MDQENTNTKPTNQPFWKSPEVFVDHFLAPFYKTDTVGSFGKLWSSILLSVCSWYWVRLRIDIPQTLESMVWVLLAYTFSTKGVQIVRDKISGKAAVSSGDAASAQNLMQGTVQATQPAPVPPTPAAPSADEG